MEFKELQKFIKMTELKILSIEDDSSTSTKMLVLQLVQPVIATGSNPVRSTGDIMRLQSNQVHVAGDDNIEEFLKDVTEGEEDGVTLLVYRGKMHLDVSKPKTRTDLATGQTNVISNARIFLTVTKYSRLGGALQAKAVANNQNFIANFFKGGKVAEVQVTANGSVPAGSQRTEAEVVVIE